MGNLNLFNLAEMQLRREGKEVTEINILNYSIKIRQWLNRHNNGIVKRILEGEQVYTNKLNNNLNNVTHFNFKYS